MKNEANRRNIIKGITIGTVWVTPVIHSVVIPAHAMTSSDTESDTGDGNTMEPTTLVCTKEIDRENIFDGASTRNANSFVTITPTPPQGTTVQVDALCDGEVIPGQSISRTTDENGIAENGFNFAGRFCPSDSTFSIRYTFEDLTAECSWIVSAPD